MKKKLNKELSAGTNAQSSTTSDNITSASVASKPSVVCRLSDVMLKLGEVHNMLARTTLSKEEYNPISNLFAVVKVELFNIYYDLKNEI